MIEVFIILIYAIAMSALARMSGGGLGAQLLNKKGEVDNTTGKDKGGISPVNLTMLPEVFFGVGIALAVVGKGLWLIPVAAWSYAWMETGHGQAFHMGFNKNQDSKRRQTLTWIVEKVSDKLKQPRYGTFYCWFFMGLKGFLIGLPLGVFAPIFAFFWPAAYALGMTARVDSWDEDKAKTGTVVGEYVTGALTGVFCAIYMLIFRVA